jgi:hypothetical protein
MAGGMKLQDAATTGNGNVVNCRGRSGRYTLAIIGAGTITGGDVQWEEAHAEAYAGTWRPLAAPITPVSGVITVQEYEGPLNYVRCRVANDITGSASQSVTARMQTPVDDCAA